MIQPFCLIDVKVVKLRSDEQTRRKSWVTKQRQNFTKVPIYYENSGSGPVNTEDKTLRPSALISSDTADDLGL